jgi:ribosomal protein S12 methylthiotransferase
MCGCVPSRYGSELADELPEVAAFVRSDEEDGIVSVIEEVLDTTLESTARPEVLRSVEAASAYVKISDGCDRFCTFCAIPYIRGRYFSRPAKEILAEVAALMAGGVREVVLIGQDTGVWGQDLEGDVDLAWLLRQVAEVVRPWKGWVRVLYLQPEGMTDDLIRVLADVDEVLPYIDIPIQHCSERVLRTMNRHGSAQQYAELFARLRRKIPGMVLRSTAMAGFPGETEEESDELYAFIQAQELDYCSVFAYSQEDGTRAARMDGQVSEEVKAERTQALVDLNEQPGFAATASHVGELADVIIDGVEEGPDGVELIGHAWFQAPDSDGAVHIAQGEAAVGDKVRVRLVDSFCYELVGQIEDAAQGGTR